MKQSQTAKDLSQHLQQRVGEVIEQQMRVAQIVLTPGEVGLVLVELAVSCSLTAGATCAANVEPDVAEKIFDTTLALIPQMAARDRERSLAAARAMAAAEGGAK